MKLFIINVLLISCISFHAHAQNATPAVEKQSETPDREKHTHSSNEGGKEVSEPSLTSDTGVNAEKIRQLELENDYLKREIDGLHGSVANHLSYVTIIIGSVSLVLAVVALLYVIPSLSKLKREYEKVENQFSDSTKEFKKDISRISAYSTEKFRKIADEEKHWEKRISKQMSEMSKINSSTDLIMSVVQQVSLIYWSESVLSRAYQQTNKVDKQLDQYRSTKQLVDADKSPDTPNPSDRLDELYSVIIETIEEGEYFCIDADRKLRDVESITLRTFQGEHRLVYLRNDIEKKQNELRVRAAVAKGLLLKRKFDLTDNKSRDLQSAIDSLLSVYDVDTGARSKAKVFFNLACYQCLIGQLDEARENLEKAIKLNRRYELSAKTDEDLKPLRDFVA